MTFVITQGCCNDGSCITVCPVQCIRPRPGDPDFTTAEQLYVDPATCIDCGACVSECPVDAVHGDYDLPEHLSDHLEIKGVEISVFDRLPTPFGLVRAGVAPDHPDTKLMGEEFRGVLSRRPISCFFNVEVGRVITIAELAEHHHAIIWAAGAADDRRLGIPGEGLADSHSAREFVAWYKGHPDAAANRRCSPTSRPGCCPSRPRTPKRCPPSSLSGSPMCSTTRTGSASTRAVRSTI